MQGFWGLGFLKSLKGVVAPLPHPSRILKGEFSAFQGSKEVGSKNRL